MTTLITPEVVGVDHTELLLNTDLTPTELARIQSLETKLRMSDATVLEQKVIQGETLFKIQQEKLYRSREPGERFTWEQYLQKFTPALTKNGKGYGMEAAQLRCLLYLFHSRQIPPGATPGGNLPLPTGTEQLRPLLGKAPIRNASQGGGFDLDGDWSAVISIWEGAVAKNCNPDRQAVAAARSFYEARQLRAGEEPGRMLSTAQQASLDKARAASTPSAASTTSLQRSTVGVAPEPTRDFSPRPTATVPAPSIPAWELEKDDSSLDAGAECKRIALAINDAHKSIGMLRGILYSQINKYGRDYLGFLRQVKAGVYSLHNIDSQVQQMADDIDFISELLTADVGEGELAQSTVDVASFPTRA
jgi:hypothetical protein